MPVVDGSTSLFSGVVQRSRWRYPVLSGARRHASATRSRRFTPRDDALACRDRHVISAPCNVVYMKGAPPASRAGPIVSAFELPEFGPRNVLGAHILREGSASAAPAGIESGYGFQHQEVGPPAAATSEQVSRLEGQLSELRICELAASTSASSAAARVTADSQAFTALDATLFGVAAVSTGSYVSVRRDMERARKEEKERQRQQQAERSSQLVRTAVGASMVTAAATLPRECSPPPPQGCCRAMQASSPVAHLAGLAMRPW